MEEDSINYDVALSALGTGINFLKKCMLDHKIIKLSNYIKIDNFT